MLIVLESWVLGDKGVGAEERRDLDFFLGLVFGVWGDWGVGAVDAEGGNFNRKQTEG